MRSGEFRPVGRSPFSEEELKQLWDGLLEQLKAFVESSTIAAPRRPDIEHQAKQNDRAGSCN